MAGRINGTPPPAPGPATQIVRVTTATPQKFVLLSSAVFGTHIHFYAKRSHECTAEKGECVKCRMNWPKKWKGYIHAVSVIDSKRVFIELTPSACNLLLGQAPIDEPLRGLMISISKTPGGAKGRYLVDWSGVRRDPVQLPPEEDPLPILRYLWNCKNPGGNSNP